MTHACLIEQIEGTDQYACVECRTIWYEWPALVDLDADVLMDEATPMTFPQFLAAQKIDPGPRMAM